MSVLSKPLRLRPVPWWGRLRLRPSTPPAESADSVSQAWNFYQTFVQLRARVLAGHGHTRALSLTRPNAAHRPPRLAELFAARYALIDARSLQSTVELHGQIANSRWTIDLRAVLLRDGGHWHVMHEQFDSTIRSQAA